MKKQIVVLVLAAVLVFGCAIGGTLAWLVDKTDTVTNVFTAGDVDITLAETTGISYKMVPGNVITKDPTITVADDSEDAYIFVKVTKVNDDEDKFLAYEIADGWTALEGESDVYYRMYDADAETPDAPYAVLKDNKVTVNGTVTKAELDALTEDTNPKIEITAYAVQQANMATAADAWAAINPAPAEDPAA